MIIIYTFVCVCMCAYILRHRARSGDPIKVTLEFSFLFSRDLMGLLFILHIHAIVFDFTYARNCGLCYVYKFSNECVLKIF